MTDIKQFREDIDKVFNDCDDDFRLTLFNTIIEDREEMTMEEIILKINQYYDFISDKLSRRQQMKYNVSHLLVFDRLKKFYDKRSPYEKFNDMMDIMNKRT